MFNAGHRKGGTVPRCEGDDNDVRLYRAFAPVALAGIRGLPGTLADRSIIVKMQRAKRNEVRQQWTNRSAAPLLELKRKAMRWANDNFSALADADPDMGGLYNRVADNWRPLYAIADEVGQGWPERVRQIATSTTGDDENESNGVTLLADLREMFNGEDRLLSVDIVEHLARREDRPWPEWSNGKPMTQRQLAKLLRPFGIQPKTIRTGDERAKGYERSQFEDAFSRYLPPSPLLIRDTVTTPEKSGEKPVGNP